MRRAGRGRAAALLLLAAAPAGAEQGAAAAPRAASARALADDAAERAVAAALRDRAGGWIGRVYAERGYRPLWAAGGRLGPAADALLDDLETSTLDGLDSSYGARELRAQLAAARQRGDADGVARVELALSKAFTRYVRDQRRARDVGMIWADPSLKPKRLKPEAVLRAAAFPRSFNDYVAGMEWMSPHYVRLRELVARARRDGVAPADEQRLRRNLERARLLPGPWTRHIVVDASSGRLWYYEAGRQVGTMKVVVGARETQTPLLAGVVQWAIVNPYWNVPTYLARKSVAPKVLAGRSLASLRMEALSDWSAAARPLPAGAIDWHAIAAGTREIRLRELPGRGNSMGRVKFLFPNDEGIYLHDTPDRELLDRDDRHLSNGCIRLEKAPVLARWLTGRPLPASTRNPEQAVALQVPVPVYLTYLTATESKARVAFRDDIYGRDAARS
ncbi:L,D-transpeptidase family protein [Sphingomonas sp. BK069]|uniref:L,D-transpeptidase family protein n=1 Tax=Sphingomonas sp. BK069 TaxID=2586979 RepID=UPI0016080BCD|nr:L,D-transpeptidase family protein [Sphingomonas sp. BK069]MBB3346278.1 murein L,D-transpeptidase YcbB/YkuD [Sphingomonas sp. BK069]